MRLPNATLLFLTGCAVFSSQVLAGENLWTPTGPRERVLSLTRDGSNPGTFYALTEAGVYRSDDLGESWDLVNANLGPDRVKVLVAYPNGSGRIMAAGCGVFQSDDFGVNWTPINRGLPSDCSFTTVGLDPYHPDSVFVGGASGYYRTDFDNAGLFWTPIAQGVITGPAVLAVSSSFYGGPSRVFAAPQDGGFLYSDDRGKTWIALVPPSGVRINALTAFDTTSYQGISFVIAATDRGLFQTGDAGRTWEPTSNPLAGIAVNSLLLSDRSGRASYAATDSGLYRDTGSGWATFSVGLPEGLPMLHIFAEPAGRRLFASSVSGDQSFVNRYGNPTIAAQLTDQTVLVNQYLALQFTISPPQPGDFAFMVESSDPIAVQSPEKVFFTPFSGSGIFGVTHGARREIPSRFVPASHTTWEGLKQAGK